MGKKKTIGSKSKEERQEMALKFELKNILERKEFGILPLNPTRFFIVGERVQYRWGICNKTYVREVFENGLYYLVETLNVVCDKTENISEDKKNYVEWHELYKYNNTKATTFRKEEKYFLNFLNSDVGSLLHLIYHAGVDFDVEYQREHVWELDDKIALIDSIFDNIDIGKFVFVQRDFGVRDKLYEIIDGKQRLTALKEFYEDRFAYNGYYFSELSHNDKQKILNHRVAYCYLERPDKAMIYETFIKLNTCGKPMAKKYLDTVKKLLNELK